jgi:hypothetical protein
MILVWMSRHDIDLFGSEASGPRSVDEPITLHQEDPFFVPVGSFPKSYQPFDPLVSG